MIVQETLTSTLDEGKSVKHVPCFAQDPVYTDLDKELLQSVGIEPVNDPEGFLSINSNSVVCEWNTYEYVIRKISERPWSVVFISFSHQLEELSVAREANGTARYGVCSSIQATSRSSTDKAWFIGALSIMISVPSKLDKYRTCSQIANSYLSPLLFP